jgi:two-component system phosphate regulon sensor histidine kinase PhoR
LALDILLENATKYTGKGKHINIKGEWLRGTELVKILIQNMGLEIKEEERDKIFELGFRGAAPREYLHHQVGYGIGLSQVKKIIEMHEGEITVDCQKKGSGPWDHLVTFTITLPTFLGRTLRM